MKKSVDSKLEAFRLTGYQFGEWASSSEDGLNGAFSFMGPCGAALLVISSTGSDEIKWEHVSVSTEKRIPNWREMCFVKNLFWDKDECVVQYHPPEQDYVNFHSYCLHMWKPIGIEMPMPPHIAVGPK